LTNPQKGIWSITMPDMINPQKGIDLMNNKSIINRILFAATIFQYVDGVCTGCVLGKHPQDTFDKGKYWRASEALQLVHSDVVGPFPTVSFQRARYFIAFIDDYSRRSGYI